MPGRLFHESSCGLMSCVASAGSSSRIEDESGPEEGAEELVQGAVKVPMGLRLTGHPGSLPGRHHEVVAQLHGVPRDLHPIAAGLCLGAKAHGIAVEGRVLHGEDEPPTPAPGAG